MLLSFCFLLLNVVFIHATTGTMCALKHDASYAGFTQCSNDMEAYEMFFNKTFSECAASLSTYDSQTPDSMGDTKTACRLKHKEAYIGFTYLSNDMKLFEQIFQEKHPECGVENNDNVHKQYPFKNKLLTITTAAHNKKKICKLKHDISYVASTYYSNNMTKYENMFMEKFPGCLNIFTDGKAQDIYDSNIDLMKSVANTSSMPKLSCVEKRLIYEQQKKEESRVMVTKDLGMIRYNNSYITRKNMNDTHFYDQYPDCKPKNFVDLGVIQSSANEVVKHRRLIERYNLCNIGSSGEYTKTANCSITTTISVSGTLKITGVADSNGAKPAIDGGVGWCT